MNPAPGDTTSTASSLPGTAEELLPLVYEELRRMASARMARESPGQTLQATALVHEAWIKLGDGVFEPAPAFSPRRRMPCGASSWTTPVANNP